MKDALPNNIATQKGIGLIEVVVALMLLAVAVLGFSMMQMRAVRATDEALVRSDVMSVISNIAEGIRMQPTRVRKEEYKVAINNVTGQNPTITDCSKGCTSEQLTQNTVNQMMAIAFENGMSVAAHDCPSTKSGELKKICLIAAWGDTLASIGNDLPHCASANGAYHRGATCMIMETY